jgi:EAL domain-containing protein (putative c-di-GMP-specific phosphodiesterase class I)/DNA-binding response OmpR family regulator
MVRPEAPSPALVLVIDDDQSIRELFTAALRRAGLDSILASTGAEGLAIAANRQVDMVLCDIGLPDMTGFDVVRALRGDAATATLPLILVTGSGGADSVIEGLQAGADDFVAKPVRIDELIARVRAHLRTRSAWLDSVEAELRSRMQVMSTLARLPQLTSASDAAALVVRELAARMPGAFAGVFQVSGPRVRILASTLTGATSRTIGVPTPQRTKYLVEHARAGPWLDVVREPGPGEAGSEFWGAGYAVGAGAPIFAGEALVGILTVAIPAGDATSAAPLRRDLLLAAVIDYAVVLSAAIGPALLARTESVAHRRRLQSILDRAAFETLYQPIVDLQRGGVVGFEALTRFTDGTPPAIRFGEAAAVGLADEFEFAALQSAVRRAPALPAGAFLALNASPSLIVSQTDQLRSILPVDRPMVIEITEHVPIDDYDAVRAGIDGLGDVSLSVDDTGAGYASMRHILELGPAYAKLDISLVRGIDADGLRESLSAGLVYYATRSGFSLIAEGVETEGEASKLRDLGVDLAQGYLFGRPAALTES